MVKEKYSNRGSRSFVFCIIRLFTRWFGDGGIDFYRLAKVGCTVSIPGKFLHAGIAVIRTTLVGLGIGMIDNPVFCTIFRFKETIVPRRIGTVLRFFYKYRRG